MLFKDQAQSLVAMWQCLRTDREIDTLAAQTAVALSCLKEVPSDVLDALDRLLDVEFEKRASSIHKVVCYLNTLTEERTVAARRL